MSWLHDCGTEGAIQPTLTSKYRRPSNLNLCYYECSQSWCTGTTFPLCGLRYFGNTFTVTNSVHVKYMLLSDIFFKSFAGLIVATGTFSLCMMRTKSMQLKFLIFLVSKTLQLEYEMKKYQWKSNSAKKFQGAVSDWYVFWILYGKQKSVETFHI